jgi:uncharacterized protein YuzE
MKSGMRFTYRRNTDIAHIDIAEPTNDANIEVKEIGDQVGFPGQVLVRFDAETGKVYGMTFQHWSAIKRRLMWRYRTLIVRNAVNDLVKRVIDFCNRDNHHHLPALSH